MILLGSIFCLWETKRYLRIHFSRLPRNETMSTTEVGMSQTSAFIIPNHPVAPRSLSHAPFFPDLPSQPHPAYPQHPPPPPLDSVTTASIPSTSPGHLTTTSSQSNNLHGRVRLGKRPIDAMADPVTMPDVGYSDPALRGECLFQDTISDSKVGDQKMKLPPGGLGLLGLGGVGGVAAGGGGGNGGDVVSSSQLKWQAHMMESWVDLCDTRLTDMPTIGFKVETDKGFNYSVADDSFVCQKKNHFQVTVAIAYSAIPKYVKVKDGLTPIQRLSVHLHGVKLEQINCEIKLEQSKSDRTKNRFEPELVDLMCFNGEPIKRTMCRLHFSETTQNNMRKRGKPNPDQKYFCLVVALHADTADGSYPVVAHVSERIIVRASNPGNFDNDCDYSWFKCSSTDSIYHHGRVGINTDKPEEALTVNGNLQITGQILHASDRRIKKNIRKVKRSEGHESHLDKLLQLQLHEYELATAMTGQPSPCQPSLCPLMGTLKEGVSGPSQVNMSTNSRYHQTEAREDKTQLHWQKKSDVHECTLSENCGVPRQGKTMSLTEDHDKDRSNRTGSKECLSHVCPRDDATGIVCHNGRSCDSHVTHNSDTAVTKEGGDRRIMGLIAQEVQQVLPDAVLTTNQEVLLSNGDVVKNLLVVDKDQVLMETLGAVQDLHTRMISYEHSLRDLKKISESSKEAHSGFFVHVYHEPSKSLLHSNLRVTVQLSPLYLFLLVCFLIVLVCISFFY